MTMEIPIPELSGPAFVKLERAFQASSATAGKLLIDASIRIGVFSKWRERINPPRPMRKYDIKLSPLMDTVAGVFARRHIPKFSVGVREFFELYFVHK